MSERPPGAVTPVPQSSVAPAASPQPAAKSDAFLCERCSHEMFRMHAVWRCPNCGFKTDCCGW